MRQNGGIQVLQGSGAAVHKQKEKDPIHLGEVLREDFLKLFGININRLARDLDVPPNRIRLIGNGERSITADTALRLGTCFGMSPETWLNLQTESIFALSGGGTGKKSSAAFAAMTRDKANPPSPVAPLCR